MNNSFEYYFVEGQCEQHFIKSSNLIGRVIILDLSEKSVDQLKKTLAVLPSQKKRTFINIVFDSDILISNPTLLSKFKENVSFLKRQGFKIRLLQQHKNFEEELIYSLSIKSSLLFLTFNARNQREFKSRFLCEQKISDKLSSLSSAFNFWTSPLINQLIEFDSMAQNNFSNLPKRPC
ncbi:MULTISPECIES: hypothetical protein [Acinetobacter]|uniref:hypothetical protein n=1 Tax=Acinetobacter TaxID=469 RepID=UPI001F61F6DD|nr:MULTISPECIES: hypothetical protein [Acinetobacter]UNT44428.1 hypothetical protein MN200_06650 [Acinetobacter sp. LUNF3]